MHGHAHPEPVVTIPCEEYQPYRAGIALAVLCFGILFFMCSGQGKRCPCAGFQ